MTSYYPFESAEEQDRWLGHCKDLIRVGWLSGEFGPPQLVEPDDALSRLMVRFYGFLQRDGAIVRNPYALASDMCRLVALDMKRQGVRLRHSTGDSRELDELIGDEDIEVPPEFPKRLLQFLTPDQRKLIEYALEYRVDITAPDEDRDRMLQTLGISEGAFRVMMSRMRERLEPVLRLFASDKRVCPHPLMGWQGESDPNLALMTKTPLWLHLLMYRALAEICMPVPPNPEIWHPEFHYPK